jgi:RNA polymerase sigma factor (sigma-70 family)
VVKKRTTAEGTDFGLGADRFGDLYRDFVTRAMRVAYLLCGDTLEAEDIVAQAFTAVYPKWKAGTVDNFFPYLRAAIVNQQRGRLRHLARDRSRPEPLCDYVQSFEEQLVDREVLHRALMSLSSRQRAAIVLRYHESLSERETAAILKVRPGTVKSHVYRGAGEDAHRALRGRSVMRLSEEAFRANLRRLAERAEASDGLLNRTQPESLRVAHPRRSAVWPLTTVAATLLAVSAVVGVALLDGDPSERVEVADGTSTTLLSGLQVPGPPSGAEGWRTVATAPLSGRSSQSAVWTGTEMIVWGGVTAEGFSAEGAAYDPRADRWRKIATGPLDARAEHDAVWTGTEMIVWGGEGRGVSRPPGSPSGSNLRLDGAAYDPARDKWRQLPTAPIEPRRRPITAIWTGQEMILWGATVTSTGPADVLGIAYDPKSDRWRDLNPAGQPLHQDASAVWTGSEMVVWGGLSPRGESAEGAAYNPRSDTWRPVPPAPIPGRMLHTAAWVGGEMVVFGGTGMLQRVGNEAAAYDPARNEWRRLPDPPIQPLGRPAVASGDRLIASSFSGDATGGAVYDRATGWAVRVPAPFSLRAGVSAVWTGEEMIVWGGQRDLNSIPETSDGAVYTPPF